MTLTITINENGCLVVETGGTYAVDGGEPQEQAKIALCRCGQSANKPFCDGTHKRVGFEAPGGEIVLGA
ncbi:MAG: CDGSH iron-sulfur domain-containing protein [Thermoleophilia bacterium]